MVMYSRNEEWILVSVLEVIEMDEYSLQIYAQKIKEHCEEQKLIDCYGGWCIFSSPDGCLLNKEPCEWELDLKKGES